MIGIEKVTAGYEGKTIFCDATVLFDDHCRIALMGPSGMGKTTFLRLLAGLHKPESGKVHSGEWNKGIAFLFQEDRLLPWCTALDNVALVSDKDTAEKFLSMMEIEDKNQYPGEMSGGMQRRVAIARALAFSGDLMLMDEPFKGLDEELKERIAARISEHCGAFIMTTHDAREAALMGAKVVQIENWIAE